MKHKIIFGGIGVVLAGVAVGVPLGITLSDTSDELSVQEKQRIELERQVAEKDREWNASLQQQEEAQVSLTTAHENVLKANEKVQQATTELNDVKAQVETNALINTLLDAISAFKTVSPTPQNAIMDEYVYEFNKLFIEGTTSQVEANAIFARFDSTVQTDATAVKDAFNAVLNDATAKALYVDYAIAQNKLFDALKDQAEAVRIENQANAQLIEINERTNQAEEALRQAEAARDALLAQIEQANKVLDEETTKNAEAQIDAEALKFWNKNTGHFEGFTPSATVTYMNMKAGTVLPPKTFPKDFKVPSSIAVIGVDAFKNATLPQGFKIEKNVTTIASTALSGTKMNSDFSIYVGYSEDIFGMLPATGYVFPSFPENFAPDLGTYEYFRNVSSLDQHMPITSSWTKPPINIDGWTMIPRNFFKNEELPAGFTIPTSITETSMWEENAIGSGAFNGATLPAGFTIPYTISVSPLAFSGVHLGTGFAFNDTYTYEVIKNAASDGYNPYPMLTSTFHRTNTSMMTSYHAPTVNIDGWKTIPYGFFENEVLPAGFTIPSTVKTISGGFIGATLPTGFSIPSSVLSIDYGAFDNAILPYQFALTPTNVSRMTYGYLDWDTQTQGYMAFNGAKILDASGNQQPYDVKTLFPHP